MRMRLFTALLDCSKNNLGTNFCASSIDRGENIGGVTAKQKG